MKAALIKLAKLILTHSEKARSGVVIAVLSIVAGFLGLMLLPVAVLSGMGGIDPPKTKFEFVESDFISSLDPDKQDKLQLMEADGQMIATALSERGLHEQIIKAQLIYFSFFEDDRIERTAGAFGKHDFRASGRAEGGLFYCGLKLWRQSRHNSHIGRAKLADNSR